LIASRATNGVVVKSVPPEGRFFLQGCLEKAAIPPVETDREGPRIVKLPYGVVRVLPVLFVPVPVLFVLLVFVP
jgi:hypothetical protein